MRWCPKCQTDKPEDHFYRRNSACKDCRRAYQREYRTRHMKRIKAYENEKLARKKKEFLGPDVY